MTTSNIALSQLALSDKNVRVVAPDKAAHKRLMASIASQGILQNLVVIPGNKEQFEVIAGGRRLRALQALAKQATIAVDYPVPCLVKSDPADITEISLAENVQHEAMHPADQFVAFATLVELGVCVEDVAAKFGVARTVVEKRLKLGRVAVKLLNEYRKGTLNLESIMAFTVTDDHKRQLACFKDLSSGHIYPRAIKHWLLGEAVDASQGIGAFVGKAAYLKSGGAVAGDLFEDTVYLNDTELVCKLAQEKLGRAVKKLEKAGEWLWVESTLDRYATTDGLVQLSAETVGVPQDMTDKIEALTQQIRVWEDCYYDEALPAGFACEDDLEKRLETTQQALDELEEERDAKYLTFSDTQKAYSGCVVTFNRAGKLDVVEGLARRKDMPKAKAREVGGEGTNAEASPDGDLTHSLKEDIGQYRQQITKAALLTQPAVAIDVLYYSLCLQVLSKQGWLGRSLQSVNFHTVVSRTSREDTEQGRAFEEIETYKATLSLAWLGIEHAGERFAAFRDLPKRSKEKLVTYCTAQTLTIGRRGASDEQDTLIEQLGIDFAAYWRPTTDNYFSRVTISQLKTQFGPMLGQNWLDGHGDAKKAVIADSLNDTFGDSAIPANDPRLTWLPEGF